MVSIKEKIELSIVAILVMIILYSIFTIMIPEAQTAGNTLNASGVPLGTLFTGNGIMILLIMVGLLLTLLIAALPSSKK